MFFPHITDTGAVMPWEYLPAAAGTYKAGQLLNVCEGELTAISAACTTIPQYLSVAERTAADGELLPVTRISQTAIYETTLSATTASAVPGVYLQISAGGEQVDGGAAGAFEVTYAEGTAQGDMVRGRFKVVSAEG